MGSGEETYKVTLDPSSKETVAVPAAVEYTSIELMVTAVFKLNTTPPFCVDVVTVGTPLLDTCVVPLLEAAET
jgi:hypothetical protein